MSAFAGSIAWTNGAPFAVYHSVASEVVQDELRAAFLVEAVVRERDTGEALRIQLKELIRLPCSTLDVFLRFVNMMKRLAIHEVEESIKVEGRRLLDPHEKKRSWYK